MRKSIVNTDQIDRDGVHTIGRKFTKLGWVFREQLTSDYGIDAQAEKLNSNGQAGGKLIALQIKTGSSYFKRRGKDYVFYGEARHREYWANHCLPVFIILHNPETDLTLWQKVEQHLIEDRANGRWAIKIPADQVLDDKHEQFIAAGIASDLASLKRARLSLDIPIIQQCAEYEEFYIRIEDWVNKTLNFRGAEIIFGDNPDGDADLEVPAWMPGYTIEYYMAVFFPWLSWEEEEYIDAAEGAGEVAVHILKVMLSDVGKAALTLDSYYQAELPPFRPAENEEAINWEDGIGWEDFED